MHQFLFCAEGDDAAVVDDGDAIAEPLRLFHVVRGVDDRGARAAQGLDHFEDAVARLRIDADGRLVHEHDPGPMDDAGGHVEAALHAAGELAGEVFGAILQGSPLEAPGDRVGQLLAGEAVIAAKGFEVFFAGEAGVDGQFLRNPAEGLSRGRRSRRARRRG